MTTLEELWYEFCCKIRKEEEERRRRKYEEWRRRNLGDCYYERLPYAVCHLFDVELGSGVKNVLQPGDKVLIRFDMEDLDYLDPCFVKKKVDEETYYVEGRVPFHREYCRCERAECDDYVIMRLPLYIRGVVKASAKYVVVRYLGDGVAEVVDTNDYDYYLAAYFYDHLEDVSGGTWRATYLWDEYRIYGENDEVIELSTCCFDDYYTSTYIVVMLMRRGETARVKYYGADDKLYEDVISASGFPPTIKECLTASRNA